MNRAGEGQNTDDIRATGEDPKIAALRAVVAKHVQEGRHSNARRACEQALARDPGKAEVFYILGTVYFASEDYGAAVEWFSRAIRAAPKPGYLADLASALARQGRIGEALQVADKAVQLKPEDATLWLHLGNLLIDANGANDALLCFQHVLKLDSSHWEAAYKAGHILHGVGRFEEALSCFDRSVEHQPNHAPTRHMRALALKNLERYEEAIAENMRAIELDPTNADTYSNLATVLQALGRHSEAIGWFDRSLAIAPGVARTVTNRAISLAELGGFEEAKREYERSLAIAPHLAITTWNLALLQLLTGDFEEGWKGREARWEIPHLSRGYPAFASPRWLGNESVAGKTLLVCADEGLGDTIQFARYIPLVAARGARVILLVEEALCPLLLGLDGIVECVPKRDDAVLPPFDFHCALDSLPLVFETKLETIPASRAYLPTLPAHHIESWERRLGARDKMRIGLVWSGNPKHHNDHNRSTSLEVLARILDVDALFVSLQKDPRPADKDFLQERRDVIDLTQEIVDFSDTAALISCLDLVIAVDTSVAHLAGALGCPTWILLPYVPDYRWLLHREKSPWYPSVRLFRQSESREYESVVDRVRAQLIEEIQRR